MIHHFIASGDHLKWKFWECRRWVSASQSLRLKRSKARVTWKSLSKLLSYHFLFNLSPFFFIVWHRCVMYSQGSQCTCEVGGLWTCSSRAFWFWVWLRSIPIWSRSIILSWLRSDMFWIFSSRGSGTFFHQRFNAISSGCLIFLHSIIGVTSRLSSNNTLSYDKFGSPYCNIQKTLCHQSKKDNQEGIDHDNLKRKGSIRFNFFSFFRFWNRHSCSQSDELQHWRCSHKPFQLFVDQPVVLLSFFFLNLFSSFFLFNFDFVFIWVAKLSHAHEIFEEIQTCSSQWLCSNVSHHWFTRYMLNRPLSCSYRLPRKARSQLQMASAPASSITCKYSEGRHIVSLDNFWHFREKFC